MYDGCGPTRSESRSEIEAADAIMCVCVRVLCQRSRVLATESFGVLVECSVSVRNCTNISLLVAVSLRVPGNRMRFTGRSSGCTKDARVAAGKRVVEGWRLSACGVDFRRSWS
jgi:hypothetical protein